MFKNWDEISKIGKDNKLLALTFAFIKLDHLNKTESILLKAFPEVLSESEVQGPYSKTKFLQEVSEKSLNDGQGGGTAYFKDLFPEYIKVLLVGFFTGKEPEEHEEAAKAPLPDELKGKTLEIWTEVIYQGHNFLVIDNCGDEVWLIPKGAINLELWSKTDYLHLV